MLTGSPTLHSPTQHKVLGLICHDLKRISFPVAYDGVSILHTYDYLAFWACQQGLIALLTFRGEGYMTGVNNFGACFLEGCKTRNGKVIMFGAIMES